MWIVPAHINDYPGSPGSGTKSAIVLNIFLGENAYSFSPGMDYRVINYCSFKKVQGRDQIIHRFFNGRDIVVFNISSHSSHFHHGIMIAVSAYFFKKIKDRLPILPDPHPDGIIT